MCSPFKSGKEGKEANKGSILLSFMMHVIYGFGLVIVLGFPWLKTKADFNLTCYLIGLQKIYTVLGYVPRHVSEHFDGGDENVSKFSIGFWGVMVGLLVCDSATLTRMPKGHTHNGADGFIAFIGRILRGFKRMGARVAGRSCDTVQSFVREIIPSAYRGTNGTGRLRSVNFLAATFQWKTFLEPYLDDELGGITSGLHIKPSLKQSEVEIRVMREKKRREVRVVLKNDSDDTNTGKNCAARSITF